MLSAQQITSYHETGFLVVPGVLSAAEIAALSAATDALVAQSAVVREHNAMFDLEPGHSAASPRVRRIKNPDLWDQAFAAVPRHPGILSCLQQLWGGRGVRYDICKLNMKSAGFGSPVEWHQDWAFYPHTNDDLAAVGVMLDDIELDNGPMEVVPGSHRGPVFDHHVDGRFCGAIDPSTPGLRLERRQPCLGAAGSITIHHVRALHGSAPNNSGRPRRFLLLQMRCADAWPLIAKPPSWEAWNGLLVAGEETLTPRMEAVPVRLPYPPALHQGSIYESQADLKNRFYDAPGETRAG
jgi:ectoine hydroxylase-related dioxygenase (phytanoyl-CoA dioxygenase family)